VRQPDQPVYKDWRGTIRFRGNAIVQYLLDAAGRGEKVDLNRIAVLPFPREDRVQFAQLIGYSVSGFGELDYVDDDSYARAERAVAKLTKA